MGQSGESRSPLSERVGRAGASAAGKLLATATRSLAALRPAAKPLHPNGEIATGTLDRLGSAVPSGVPWLDAVGEDEVVVRLSRAIGLPRGVPDIHGMALRVPTDGGAGDLLFASTGWGRLGRFVLTAGVGPQSRPMTTLLPYRTAQGPIVLGARSAGARTWQLSWSRPAGGWQPFAELHLGTEPAPDQSISFDPISRQLPGLDQYRWAVRLREPSYRTARASRS